MTIFRLGVAAELYERICEHFPGIGRFRAGMAAVLVLLAGSGHGFHFSSQPSPSMGVPADRS